MNALGSLARASLIVCAMSGCAAPATSDDSSQEAPVEEEPLDVTIDALDVAHGALRISATMADGAADVSVLLGGACERREVGGGLSTRSTLVWSLGDGEVAEAIRCGLVVRARIREGRHSVNRVAELGVAVDVSPQEGENADDGPQLQSVTASELGVALVFSQVTRSARLTTCDSILEAAQPTSEEEVAAASDGTARFDVPPMDFARSFLGGRRFHLDGSSFVAALAVGGTQLEAAPEAQEEAQTGVEVQGSEESEGSEETQSDETDEEDDPASGG